MTTTVVLLNIQTMGTLEKKHAICCQTDVSFHTATGVISRHLTMSDLEEKTISAITQLWPFTSYKYL